MGLLLAWSTIACTTSCTRRGWTLGLNTFTKDLVTLLMRVFKKSTPRGRRNEVIRTKLPNEDEEERAAEALPPPGRAVGVTAGVAAAP